MTPPELWCTEQLDTSPSTSVKFEYEKDSMRTCAVPYRKSTNRKRPLAMLLNNFHDQPTNQVHGEWNSPKKFAIENALQSPQVQYVPADFDKVVHYDSRSLKSLLRYENNVFFSSFTKKLRQISNTNSLTVDYRMKAVEFIRLICIEENCDIVIFPLAVSYYDRIIAQLQHSEPDSNVIYDEHIASTCFLLASKMKAPIPVNINQILMYTSANVTHESILKYEDAVLCMLNWDLGTPTLYEFFDQLLVRAPELETIHEDFGTLAEHLQFDEELARMRPSEQAAVCVSYLCGNEYADLINTHLGVQVNFIKKQLPMLHRHVWPLCQGEQQQDQQQQNSCSIFTLPDQCRSSCSNKYPVDRRAAAI